MRRGNYSFRNQFSTFQEGACALSGGLGIVLIIIVWLFVLAPWLLRSQRPVSHTGEAFDDTRVLFEGGSGNVEGRRRPKLTPGDIHAHEQDEEDYELVEAVEEDTPRQTIAGAAARAKADTLSSRGNRFFAYGAAEKAKLEQQGSEETESTVDASARETFELIDGEVVEETPAEAAESYRASQSLPQDAELVEDVEDLDISDEIDEVETHVQPRVKRVSLRDRFDEDVLEENLLDQPMEREDAEGLKAHPGSSHEPSTPAVDREHEKVAAAEVEIFTAPALAAVSEDAYELDETYTSPVDLLYPGAVDPQPVSEVNSKERASEAQAPLDDEDRNQGNAEGLEQSELQAAGRTGDVAVHEMPEDMSEELSEEELEFAARRMGRGGWDPIADKQASASRFQRRQRTLIALAIVVVATVALGIVVGGWAWMAALAAGIVSTLYLVALRSQVRQEHALRTRRIRQLRRARLGVRNASDDELAIPRNLRRPGAVVLEADDDSPDFDHLPVHFADDDVFDPSEPQRRRGRDDLAARRVG